MRTVAPAVAVAILLTVTRANALDPSHDDIIGLRLGMAERQAAAELHRQGFATTHDHGDLVARTGDGRMVIEFASDRTARRIRYIFQGSGPGEPEKIRAAIIDRFGNPDQMKPMTWCGHLDSQATCPVTEPSLVFLPATLTLILQSTGANPR